MANSSGVHDRDRRCNLTAISIHSRALLVERGEQRRERGPDARSAFHAITCRRGGERNCQTITQAYERASASASTLGVPASDARSDHAVAQNVLGQVCLCLYWDDVHILERLRQAACEPGGGART